jgi:hypothetical protein
MCYVVKFVAGYVSTLSLFLMIIRSLAPPFMFLVVKKFEKNFTTRSASGDSTPKVKDKITRTQSERPPIRLFIHFLFLFFEVGNKPNI